MPKKYHIHTSPVPARQNTIGKYTTVEFREDCAGSCRKCVKKNCIYDIFKDNYKHISTMEEPEYLYTCNSCFRCVQECTKGIFSRVINPEYRTLGDKYWTSDIIYKTWLQAYAGKIPVSGAGYRGPFVGYGFDSMWTDMSEIVRPTRDGIHGREYINTCIELSRRPLRLSFNNMSLETQAPEILEIPLPILFQQPEFGVLSPNILISMACAAKKIGTFMFINAKDLNSELMPYITSLIPCVDKNNYKDFPEIIRMVQMVEIDYDKEIDQHIEQMRKINNNLFISVGMKLNSESSSCALGIAFKDIDTIHFYANNHGQEYDSCNQPLFIKEKIREIHLALVKKSIRRKVNLLFSGGMAMAEHVAKAIICGADGVVVDNSLLVAMECRMCYRCKDGLSCPAELEKVEHVYGSQRIINLMGAWHSQLLEIMGAMGLREARRLRGEVGRSMWFEDLEKECFGPIFGQRKVLN